MNRDSGKHPRSEVLGRLLVALQCLDILPSRKEMAEFLEQSLREVPGVAGMRLMMADQAGEGAAGTTPMDGALIESIPMRTPRVCFGELQLRIDDPAAYAHYRSFLINIGHMLATILENRDNAGKLAEANRQLSQLVGELEQRVEERTRHLLENQQQLLLSAKVFENSAEAIIITDARQRILSVNRSFTEITGYAPDEVIGRTPRVRRSGHLDKGFYQAMWRTIAESGQWQGEILNRRRNGEIYPEWLSITAVHNEAGDITHYIGISSDITERKRDEARIQFLAYHDQLTELPNRVLFRECFDKAKAIAERESGGLALMLLNLDEFKSVNDFLGHLGGDQVLQAVAQRLRSSLKPPDIVARHDGDEFMLLIQSAVDRKGLAAIAESLLERVNGIYPIDGNEVDLSASLGIALLPDDGRDFIALVKHVDSAMLRAKKAGRNTYRFFADSMDAGAIEQLTIRNKLRGALERGEFQLHYQPQIDLSGGHIVGAEALLRWLPPGEAPVSPQLFIPVAEASGLIVPLGEWVLQQACRDAADWNRELSPGLMVAVNLSAVQFHRGNLEQTVQRALRQAGLPPERLELEFTESVLINDDEQVTETIHALKALGVALSIDDFGTGYSSLAYLRRFHVDHLKIDRSFIQRLPEDTEDLAIVRAIADMAHGLGLRLIAEGVETEAAAAMLRQLRCDMAQGFLYSRPVPAARFAELLKAWRVPPR